MREHSTPSLTIHACDYCHALRRQEELDEVVREASPGWQCRDAAAALQGLCAKHGGPVEDSPKYYARFGVDAAKMADALLAALSKVPESARTAP